MFEKFSLKPNFYPVFIVPAIGSSCTQNDDCTEELLVCIDGICECEDGYFQSGISECAEGMIQVLKYVISLGCISAIKLSNIYLNAKEAQPFSIHFFFNADHMGLFS